MILTALGSWTPSVANSSNGDNPLILQARYEIMHFNKGGETHSNNSDISWRRDELLKTVLEMTEKGDGKPLIEGWISNTAYGRLYRNREVYFVFAPKLGTPLADVCRVVVTGASNSAHPQSFAGGGGDGDKWCSEPVRAEIAPTPSQVRATWHRGQVEDIATFHASDKTTLSVSHVTNLKEYDNPLPPIKVVDVLTFGRMPVSLESVRRTDRHLEVSRLADGGWGLMLKYAPSWTNLSGCFITADDSSGVPSESWITPEIEQWCRSHAARYFASIPPQQKPMPHVVMGQLARSWSETW